MDEIPVLRHLEVDAVTAGAWRSGGPAGCRTIRIGILTDGRWFVALTGRRDLTLACRDEARARQLAGEWMADGTRWEPTALGPAGAVAGPRRRTLHGR